MDFIRKNWLILSFAVAIGAFHFQNDTMNQNLVELNSKVDNLQIQVAQQGVNIQWLKDQAR